MSNQHAPAKKRNLDALTSWRFFAAALVIFYHYGAPAFVTGPKYILQFINNGFQAVSFFFVLSGFVLVYTYYESDSQTPMKTTPQRFWLARFARIYPVYALALLPALPAFLWSAHIKKSMPLLDIGLTLGLTPMLLQAWVPPACLAWNAPAWSLSVEAFFYLLFPWLVSSMGRWKSRTFLITSVIFAIAGYGLLHWISPLGETGAPNPETTLTHDFFAYFPLFHLPSFLFGMALGKIYLEILSPGRNPRFYNTIMVASLAVICALFFLHGQIWPVFLSQMVTVPIYGLLIFSSAHCSGILRVVLANRYLIALGNASYGMYIIHHPAAWWLSVCLKRFSAHHASCFFSFYFFVVVGASLLIHKYFEMPLKHKCLTLFTPKV